MPFHEVAISLKLNRLVIIGNKLFKIVPCNVIAEAKEIASEYLLYCGNNTLL